MDIIQINFKSSYSGREIEVINEKSYTQNYLKQIFQICKRRRFFFKGCLAAGENNSRLSEDGSTFHLSLWFSTSKSSKPTGLFNREESWIGEEISLTISTDPTKNKINIVQKCSFKNMKTYSFHMEGSGKIVYSRDDISNNHFERIELCANALCTFMKEMNDDFIRGSNFHISVEPLPRTDNRIGRLMSQAKDKETFTFFCKEENYVYELPISSFYLTTISPIFEKLYNPLDKIGLLPTTRRELKISKYCLQVIFKKIIFGLSFSDVDFHQIHEGEFIELLSIFCEFEMEITYTTLVSLFVRLNISPIERSRILSCEFPKAINEVVAIL